MKSMHEINEKPPKSLEEVLKQINRNNVQIKKKHRKCNNAVLFGVLGKFLKLMQSHSKLFRRLKPRLEYLGSYFDRLRVGQPTEYDINIILKIPVSYKKITLDARATAGDYTSIIMPTEFRRLSNNPKTANEGFGETKMWCDAQFRLSVSKFRSWMQSVVDAALGSLPQRNGKRILCLNNKYYQIFTKLSGPAHTLTIIIGSDIRNIIDIDLVPTFEFKLPKKPIGSKVLFTDVETTKYNNYFVVPKPSDNDHCWRLSFPFQERYYLSDMHNLKSTLKLLKLLRDAQGFTLLASYFIKTIFLWECKTKSECFWRTHSMSYLLLHMMRKLRDCLTKGEIKNFWCPESNVIDKIGNKTSRNWSNRLTFIINDIEENGKQNPQIVSQYFN